VPSTRLTPMSKIRTESHKLVHGDSGCDTPAISF
jgi:hypothetical protein